MKLLTSQSNIIDILRYSLSFSLSHTLNHKATLFCEYIYRASALNAIMALLEHGKA